MRNPSNLAVTQDSANQVRKDTFFVQYQLIEARHRVSKRVLAAHQQAAITKLGEWFMKSEVPHGGLIVLPTGGGKTFTAIRFLCQGPLSQGYKVLWLAHTHHLLEQAFFELGPRIGDDPPQYAVGYIREPRDTLSVRVVSGTPGHFRVAEIKPTDDFVIATLQTICKANEASADGHPNLTRFFESCQGKLCVIFDEAHHSPAPSYRRLIDSLRRRYPQMYLLGLTATPTYSEERKRGWLGKLFPQGMLCQVSPSDLQAAGILAKPLYEEPRTHFAPSFEEREYQKWLGTYQDLPDHIIESLANNRQRNETIVNWYVSNKKRYGKTIIFADRWFQCQALCELFRARGVDADAVYSHVDANLPTIEERNRRTRDENAKVLQEFRRKANGVLINVKMLTEGTDLPDVQTVFLTRQTTSQILFTQMVGRALRGPKFGGTQEARIVCFIDDWKQMINWAGFADINGGASDEDTRRVKHPPLQLISIELVSRLARQMDSGQLLAQAPFLSLIPVGWYKVEYRAQREDSDDVETHHEMVLVFDSQQNAYRELIQSLLAEDLSSLENENLSLGAVRSNLRAWGHRFFDTDEERLGEDLSLNLFRIGRHVAQHGTEPAFFTFEEREQHNLDALYMQFRQQRLVEDEVEEQLRHEYENAQRFWKVMYWNYTQFRGQYDACRNRIFEAMRLGKSPGDYQPTPVEIRPESLTDHEPPQAVKDMVFSRDQGRCLCCGETQRRLLEIDHINPRYFGVDHDLDNLQTLCRTCNNNRGTKGNTNQWNYRIHRTSLTAAPEFPALVWSKAVPRDVRSTEEWERFLRRTINTFYRCAAVESVRIGKRGDLFYRWEVRLFPRNNPAWLRPHLPGLANGIRLARQERGVGGPEEIRCGQEEYPKLAVASRIQIVDSNPFDKKEDSYAHTAFCYLAKKKPQTVEALEAVLEKWLDSNYEMKNGDPLTDKKRRSEMERLKNYLIKEKAIVL